MSVHHHPPQSKNSTVAVPSLTVLHSSVAMLIYIIFFGPTLSSKWLEKNTNTFSEISNNLLSYH